MNRPSITALNAARHAWIDAQRKLRYGCFTTLEEYQKAQQEEDQAFDIYYNLHVDYHRPQHRS